jgi:hypothetical protein
MGFDGERAWAESGAFAELRPAGSEAERQAVARVAAALIDAGWRVERIDATAEGEPDDSPMAFGLAAAFSGLALELTDVVGLGPPGMGVLAAVFLGLVLVSRVDRRLRTGRWTTPRVGSPGVRARRPDDGAAPCRVVLLTHSETRPPDSSYRLRRVWTALDAAWLAVLWVPCLVYGAWPWLDRAGPALLAGLGLLALLRTLDPWHHRPTPYPGDNRTGLALLVELAQAWPRSAPGRVEAQLLVVGRRDPEDWGRLARSWSDKPTLLVNLEAPGVGTRLVVVGAGEPRALARAAAADLWLPHRAARRAAGPLDHESLPEVPALSLTGQRDAPAANPGLLAATAQLTLETALRWATRQALLGEPTAPGTTPGVTRP